MKANMMHQKEEISNTLYIKNGCTEIDHDVKNIGLVCFESYFFYLEKNLLESNSF